MIKSNVDYICKVCKGSLIQLGQSDFCGVSTDSRTLSDGQLFIALVGPTFNGHAFLNDAIEKGAVAVMVSAPPDQDLPDYVSVVLVEDTVSALQDLAEAYLKTVNPKKIAVTGSTGKSSTKELIHAVLSERFKAYKNIGNLNNHIGLPLTILSMPSDTEVLVLEMGMNHYGEIRRLCEIVQPDIGVITNIGDSHIANFGSREGILKSKMEITDYFGQGHLLIVNGRDPLLQGVESSVYQVMQVGQSTDLSYESYSVIDDAHSRFILKTKADSRMIDLPLVGQHNASNALLAVAVAQALNMDLDAIQMGLQNVKPLKMRLNVRRIHDLAIIDDTYNASPDSVLSALDVLLDLKVKRRLLVFADILELGHMSHEIHLNLGQRVSSLGLDYVFAYGEDSQFFHAGLKTENAMHFHDSQALVKDLLAFIRPGDGILFKGSRGMQVDLLCNQVIERGPFNG